MVDFFHLSYELWFVLNCNQVNVISTVNWKTTTLTLRFIYWSFHLFYLDACHKKKINYKLRWRLFVVLKYVFDMKWSSALRFIESVLVCKELRKIWIYHYMATIITAMPHANKKIQRFTFDEIQIVHLLTELAFSSTCRFSGTKHWDQVNVISPEHCK